MTRKILSILLVLALAFGASAQLPGPQPGGGSSSSGGTGSIAQVVTEFSNTTGSTTSNVPGDNTIPQNTEGVEFDTISITPTNASSTLLVESCLFLSVGTAVSARVTLFRDSTANSIGATFTFLAASGAENVCAYASVSASSTDETTFKVRYGSNGTITVYVNQNNGTATFGGVITSYIKVTEILP